MDVVEVYLEAVPGIVDGRLEQTGPGDKPRSEMGVGCPEAV